MSKKESKDYFKKLMNDTQNKINSIDSNPNSLKFELIKSGNKNEKSSTENVKIDKSKQNLEQNMSDTESIFNMADKKQKLQEHFSKSNV